MSTASLERLVSAAVDTAFPPKIRRERPADRPPLLPHQVPPLGEWTAWLLMAGRGGGKTEAGSDYFDTFMVENPASRGRIIGPTLGDVFESCIDGPSGLKALNPSIRVIPSAPGGSKVVWPNGSEAVLLGTHSPSDVERLRATGNRHIDWWEEAAANRNLSAAWDQAAFGLRLGVRPRSIVTTTPRNVKKIRELIAAESTKVSRGTINDNPYLNQGVKDALVKQYEGTRIGRQELDGELLTDVPGALWTWAMIGEAHASLPSPVPDMQRVVVAIDPAVTSNEDSDETGIVVCGRGSDDRGYVLADYSCHVSPDKWAKRAVWAFDEHEADRIVAETNNGGDLVETVLRTIRATIPFEKITASRGKAIRAEPVSALYEQGRISHVGEDLGELEAQLCEWSPGDDSPDRLDALVWAFHELGFCKEQKRWRVA